MIRISLFACQMAVRSSKWFLLLVLRVFVECLTHLLFPSISSFYLPILRTVKGHLVSITETAPPMSNAGFKTPQRRFENVNGEYFFSIGVTDKKKDRSQTERKTYSERKVARKSTLFGSRTRRSSIARVHIKQPSTTRAHRADKVGNLRAVNPAALFPGTPEQHSRSGTPSKPTPLPFNVFN